MDTKLEETKWVAIKSDALAIKFLEVTTVLSAKLELKLMLATPLVKESFAKVQQFLEAQDA